MVIQELQQQAPVDIAYSKVEGGGLMKNIYDRLKKSPLSIKAAALSW